MLCVVGVVWVSWSGLGVVCVWRLHTGLPLAKLTCLQAVSRHMYVLLLAPACTHAFKFVGGGLVLLLEVAVDCEALLHRCPHMRVLLHLAG